MEHFLWLIVAIPLFSFLVLAIFNDHLGEKGAALFGVGSIGLSMVVTTLVGLSFIGQLDVAAYFVQTLWTWMEVGDLKPAFAFRLDALSLVFIFVITFVGFWIHVYSRQFMQGEEGYARFFAYMNLFVASMLILVLADNLLLLYLGWEGVGLCSFLLIGFWYKERSNARAARKAFVVTRIGDTVMAIGLFLLFKHFNTLNISEIMAAAPTQWTTGSSVATATALLLLGGAVGKSAQLPLQTWLPDAMAGPSPVSALIHAATMVTAGVYLIARTNVLFELAPVAQTTVAIIGAATLLMAGFSALAQRDIKRVLAYSTISQIGYMFLALGVGAYTAAVFHFMIHAFFKALLFLAAGAVIMVMHHEHDMFKMGGLKKSLPVTFWTFLIGSASLAALPLVTAGFYSKDQILWYAWAAENGSFWLWLAGIAGAFITAVYTFRMVFVTFYGEQKMKPEYQPNSWIKVPLIVLAILSLVGGFINLPHSLGHWNPFGELLHYQLPEVAAEVNIGTEIILQLISALLALAGVYLAWLYFVKKPELAAGLAAKNVSLLKFWGSGWRFDQLYDAILVRPYIKLAKANRKDFFDYFYRGLGRFNLGLSIFFGSSQNGRLRWYLAGIVLGAVLSITIILLL